MAKIRFYDAPQRNSITRTQKSPANANACQIERNFAQFTESINQSLNHTQMPRTHKTGEIGKNQ